MVVVVLDMCCLFLLLELLYDYINFRCCPGKLMTALVNDLSDRNVSVRKAAAKSIGHLVKVSPATIDNCIV